MNNNEYPPNLLEAIFEKQRELMTKYHPIEEKNGMLWTKDIPVNLHCKYGQAQLKDFAWRFTEEITEATEALEIHPGDKNFFYEELIDALHFLTELCILSGVDSREIATDLSGIVIQEKSRGIHAPSIITTTKVLLYLSIEELGKATNCLKNRPWKRTYILTDEVKYKNLIMNTFRIFCGSLFLLGLNSKDVYNIYTKKNEVNKIRQEEKY